MLNSIQISSTSGLHGNAGQINYATAKMGVVGMTKTIAKEWGMFNIRCNAIAFGMCISLSLSLSLCFSLSRSHHT